MSNEARETEAKKAAPTVTWREHTFNLPADYTEWSVDLLESLEEGKAAGIVRGALGPEQWRIFRAANPKTPDLDELTSRITAAMGFKTGESAAS